MQNTSPAAAVNQIPRSKIRLLTIDSTIRRLIATIICLTRRALYFASAWMTSNLPASLPWRTSGAVCRPDNLPPAVSLPCLLNQLNDITNLNRPNSVVGHYTPDLPSCVLCTEL